MLFIEKKTRKYSKEALDLFGKILVGFMGKYEKK